MSILMALGSMMGGKGKSCPDCGSPTQNGECPECGYGSEDDGMEMDEVMENRQMMEIRDDLQRIVAKLGQMIAEND